MPSYNHEKFVASTIESVLQQSFGEFEFLIADDGSKDKTAKVIESFSDPRIHFSPHTINRGAGVVTRELILRAKGKYIALVNSDDTWPETKLSEQFNFLENNEEFSAHFGRAQFIDEHGGAITKSTLPFGAVFDKNNRSRGMWLRYFFDRGNCICHPTMMIRRKCYDSLGTYDNRLRQLPDYKMWIEFVKKYSFFISNSPLVNFRILPGENASSISRENLLRTINEHYIIANDFFRNVDRELMMEAFGDRLIQKEIPSEKHLLIEQTLQFFNYNQWLGIVYNPIGLERLYSHLEDPTFRKILEHDYKIDDRYFHKVMAEYSGFKPLASMSQFGNREVFDEFKTRCFGYLRSFGGAALK